MKKILLVALGVSLFMVPAQAQKQAGGEKNLQVLFAPLGGSPISLNGISFRKFNGDGTSAWRVNLFIGLTNKKEVVIQASDTSHYSQSAGNVTYGLNPEGDKKTSGMTISIRPGYEMHMAGTEKLSPYWGAELLFSTTSSTIETDTVDHTTNTNTGAAISVPYAVYTKKRTGDGASTTFGLNIIAGCDYYIAKNLSLGAEIGFGFSTTSMPDIEDQRLDVTTTTTQVPPSITTTYSVVSKAKEKQGTSMQVGPNVVGQFKLGWLF